ncbi:MAG: dTDP-glucose 4,6-dehydratase [Candidatus Tectimicrobiota bacterium]
MITGGAGFIGCHLVRHFLCDPQIRVLTLDLLTYAGSLHNLADLPHPERHLFVQGDICDQTLVMRLLRAHEIDTIVHCAAESHVDRSITGPAAFIQTNVVGTFTLLEAARQTWLHERHWDGQRCRFHQVSTDEVYGTLGADEPPWSEPRPYMPNSPYAASKAAADHLVRSYHRTYGLPTTTTHCSNNYGPCQHEEKFVPTIIKACLAGRSIPVYGDGTNIRDWLYVADHCAGIDAVIRHGCIGESYNIGGGLQASNLDIVHHVCTAVAEVTGVPLSSLLRLAYFVPDRPGHDWRYAVDTTRIRHELHWSPRETFETGLRKTIAWYRDRKDAL